MLFNLSQTVEHLSNSIIQSTTEETVRELNSFLDPATGTLKVAREWGGAEMLETLNPVKLNPQFIPVLKNYRQISSMLIANTSGREYMLLREDSTWLNRVVDWHGPAQEIKRYRWKYDEHLNVLGSESWIDTKKYDPRERPWFTGGLKSRTNELSWTQPYVFFTTKDPGMTVSMNWKSAADGQTYVIAFDILLIDISAYTSRLGIGKNGKAFILTSDNKIIGLPKDSRLLNTDSLKKFVLSDYSSLAISELTAAVDQWKSNGRAESPFTFSLNKKDWWAGIHQFRLGSDNMFYIGVVVPEEDFMSEVNRTRTVIIAAFLLVLVLTLLVIRGYNQKQKAYALLEIQNKQILQQKEEIEKKSGQIAKQRDKIEEQRNEITASIKYSKRIQTAVMPPENVISAMLPGHFVFFRPKDIVSGDFYWVHKLNRTVYWAAADCTGHGVPGAIMSMIGYNGLNRSIREYGLSHPGEVLDRLNHIIAETFRQDNQVVEENVNQTRIRDGMDIALCSFDPEKMIVEYAAANNSLLLVRNDSDLLEVNGERIEPAISGNGFNLFEIKADRQPIGSYDSASGFRNNIIRVESGDALYTFSDGFADQFGGADGKKFMSRNLKSLLLKIHNETMNERLETIDEIFNGWKGNYEQVDDVLIFGVEI
jgi:serine phosphatase RsbU (regulator of sigma subunit)